MEGQGRVVEEDLETEQELRAKVELEEQVTKAEPAERQARLKAR